MFDEGVVYWFAPWVVVLVEGGGCRWFGVGVEGL